MNNDDACLYKYLKESFSYTYIFFINGRVDDKIEMLVTDLRKKQRIVALKNSHQHYKLSD